MSSLPASPNPQKPRLFTLGRRVGGALLPRLRSAGIRPEDGPGQQAAAASPARHAADPPPPAVQASLAVPAVPASLPGPALPARIPYSEWKGPRPRAVRLGFTVIILAGFISLAGGVAASRRTVTELPAGIAQLGQLGLSVREYAAAVQIVTLATSLVVFGLYVLFACMIREGRNWARIGGSLLAGAALVLALRTGTEPQTWAALVAVAGLVPLYGRQCARYFRPRRSQYLGMS